MAQWVTQLLVMLACHMELPVFSLAALLATQLPANVPGKAAEDDPSIWVPATFVGKLDGAPGSWLFLQF